MSPSLTLVQPRLALGILVSAPKAGIPSVSASRPTPAWIVPAKSFTSLSRHPSFLSVLNAPLSTHIHGRDTPGRRQGCKSKEGSDKRYLFFGVTFFARRAIH